MILCAMKLVFWSATLVADLSGAMVDVLQARERKC